MKTFYFSLIIAHFLGSSLKAQDTVETINCYGPSASELYTLLDSDLVVFAKIIKNHGPFSDFKIEAILQQKGIWFKLGDTISIFMDDLYAQQVYLNKPIYRKARLALNLGTKHWELKSGSHYSYRALGKKHQIDMLDKMIELPRDPAQSAKVLRDFLAIYRVKFSEGISPDCLIKGDSLNKLKKTNPLINLFEKQNRVFIDELEYSGEEDDESIISLAQTIDSLPKKILNPQLLDSSQSIAELLTITNFQAMDDNYAEERVRVFVEIYINEQGKVYQTKLLKGFRDDYNKYALERALKSGPWLPLQSEGVSQKGYFHLPFNFIEPDEN